MNKVDEDDDDEASQPTTSCRAVQYKGNYNNLILYIYLKGNKIPINFSTKM